MKRIATNRIHMLTIALVLFSASGLFAQDNDGKSIEEFINPDGSFNLEAARLSGYEGSLDMDGFESIMAPVSGQPMFQPTDSRSTTDHPDDIYWDNSISPMNETVLGLTVYDGKLIAGGYFTTAGAVNANRIASWDGSAWSVLGSGMDEHVYPLTVYDGKLIAGGFFRHADGVDARMIASWDGSSWSPLGSELSGGYVLGLTVYDGKLIAGGAIDILGGWFEDCIASWDGNSWSPLGSGMEGGGVSALTVYDGKLIAGGEFTWAGGVAASHIASWDGTSWSPLGSGLGGDPHVYRLTVYDGKLIAGGEFTWAGSVEVKNIASWDGSSWSSLGLGMNGRVRGLTVYDGKLIAGGIFTTADGVAANHIAAWDGSSWSPLGSGMGGDNPSVIALTVYDGDLIAGGDFTIAGNKVSAYVATWTKAASTFCDGFTGLFCDDFENTADPLWVTLTGSQPGSCTWEVTDGTYGTSQTGVDQMCIQSVLNNDWQNYVYEVDVRGNAGVNKEITFRAQDGLNTYDLNLMGDPINVASMNKVVSGISTNLSNVPFSSQTGVWYHVKVACLDSTFKVYVDDVQVLQYTDNDSPYLSGGIGLVNWTGSTGECDISFDNVAVTDPFPHIVFTDATGVNIGENITISGQVQYADGSAYTPLAPGNIGCEDPVSLMSRMVSVEADGSFELTTTNPVTYAGLYDFAFGANYDGSVILQHLFLPVSEPPDPIHPTVQTGLEIGVGTTKTYPKTNQAITVQFPLVSSWEIIAPLVNEYYQTGKTSWQRTTTSPTGKMITGLRNQAFDDCSWSPLNWSKCALGAEIFSLQVAQSGHPLSLLRAAFTNAWGGLRDLGLISQSDIEDLDGILDLASVVIGGWKATSTKKIVHIVQAAQSLANATLTRAEVLVKRWDLKDGGIEEFLAMVEDDEGNIYVVYLHPKWENMTRISSWCPVDLVVTNPSGLVVSKDINEIPGAEYIEYDFDGDGELEDQILIPDTSFGLYQIEVVPEEGAADTDSFSLYVTNSYWTEGITLVDHGLIGDIPPVPYTCSTFVNLQPAAFDLIGPNGAEFYGATPIPFSWENTLDPNPDHITLFDLIIAPDSLFIDTVVLYDQTDTILFYTDTLPTDSLDDKYFWKVRAHDLWGASTLSDQTYSFIVTFVCGDINASGGPGVDISDLVYLVDYMFLGGPEPSVMQAADVNGSGGIDIADLVYLVDYMFNGGPPPACL